MTGHGHRRTGLVADRPHLPPRPAGPGRRQRPDGSSPVGGWTVHRLINGASLGGIATVVGGLVFQKNFEFLGKNSAPLLAAGFGLFVIGMIVFTLCLIGLSAAAVRALAAGPGWGAAVGAALAPTVVLLALFAAGLVPFAVPALLAIVVAGGFVVALRR
jgi:hypothetical protein